MKTVYFQKGLSPLGGLLVAAVAGFALMVIMQLMPHYLDYSGIKKVHDNMALEEETFKMSKLKREGWISKRLLTHQIRDYNPENTYIGESENGVPVLGFKYEIREHMLANVSAVLEFEYEAEFQENP